MGNRLYKPFNENEKTEAFKARREIEELLIEFIREECVIGNDCVVPSRVLRSKWIEWLFDRDKTHVLRLYNQKYDKIAGSYIPFHPRQYDHQDSGLTFGIRLRNWPHRE